MTVTGHGPLDHINDPEVHEQALTRQAAAQVHHKSSAGDSLHLFRRRHLALNLHQTIRNTPPRASAKH